MALKNLFLRRKSTTPPPPDAASDAGNPAMGDHEPAAERVEAVPHPLRVAHQQVETRVRSVRLAADLRWDQRCTALLERLVMVLDPNEVVLSGTDCEAQIILSNRRLIVGRFRTCPGAEHLFDFRQPPAAEADAMACMQALGEMCKSPGDLLISERPVSGVVAADCGLALQDMVFDATAYLAILQQQNVLAEGAAAPGAAAEEGDLSPAPEVPQPQLSPPEPMQLAVDPAAFPFAMLRQRRSFARDVLVQTRQGAASLPPLVTPAEYQADLGPAFQSWQAAVSQPLGPELMVLLIPADPNERVCALTLDGESAVAFGLPRQSLGTVAKAARDLMADE